MPPLNPPSELTVQEVMESFRAVQKTDVMITLDSLSGFEGWLKPGELQVVKAASGPKTRLSPGVTVMERDENPYDPNAMNYEPDGLTSEEQGPCT